MRSTLTKRAHSLSDVVTQGGRAAHSARPSSADRAVPRLALNHARSVGLPGALLRLTQTKSESRLSAATSTSDRHYGTHSARPTQRVACLTTPADGAHEKRASPVGGVTMSAFTVVAAIDWGNVPTWVSAIATSAGLIFLFFAAIVARRTYLLQDGERRRAQAQMEKAQAALVSVWWGSEPAPSNGTLHDPVQPQGTAEERPRTADCAWLLNASTGPIYRAVVQAEFRHSGHTAAAHLPVVLPGVPRRVLTEPESSSAKARKSASDYAVSVRFTDASGLRWVRDEYGGLTQLDPTFEIWTSPETAAVLEPFVAEFPRTYGVAATVESRYIERDLKQRFLDASPGPDVLVAPHDWLGRLRARGAITPITLWDEALERLSVPPLALEALRVAGQTYGVPSSLDTVALIRNTELVPEEPASFEEIIGVGEQLRDRRQVRGAIAIPVGRHGNPFHIWPLVAPVLAPLFKLDAGGGWEPDTVRLTSEHALTILSEVAQLARRRLIRTDIGAREAEALFTAGEVPYLISSSGPAIRAQRAGVAVAVSEVPGLDGVLARPLVAVYAFYIAARGRNRMLAQDLIPDYLSRPDVIDRFGGVTSDVPGSVVPLHVTAAHHPVLQRFHQLCTRGDVMPSFCEMDDIWTCIAAAELSLIAGREGVSQIASRLAAAIEALHRSSLGAQRSAR